MSRKGFTLIEMIVVTLIAVLLAGFAFNSYRRAVREGELDRMKVILAQIGHAVDRLTTDYPSATLAWGRVLGVDNSTTPVTAMPIPEGCQYKAEYRISVYGRDRGTTGEPPIENLISCGYLENKDWVGLYNYGFMFFPVGIAGGALQCQQIRNGVAPTACLFAIGNQPRSGQYIAAYYPGEGVVDL